jgi:hypothetical protein
MGVPTCAPGIHREAANGLKVRKVPWSVPTCLELVFNGGIKQRGGCTNLSVKSRSFDVERRLVPGASFRYRTGHAKTCHFCAFSGDECSQEHAFRPHDAQFFLIDFDAPGERAEVITAVAAVLDPHALARCPGIGLPA